MLCSSLGKTVRKQQTIKMQSCWSQSQQLYLPATKAQGPLWKKRTNDSKSQRIGSLMWDWRLCLSIGSDTRDSPYTILHLQTPLSQKVNIWCLELVHYHSSFPSQLQNPPPEMETTVLCLVLFVSQMCVSIKTQCKVGYANNRRTLCKSRIVDLIFM